MTRHILGWILVAAPFALVTIVAPAAAEACSLMPHQMLEIVDEDPDGEEPPQLPVVEVTNIKRGTGPRSEGCGESYVTSCDDVGWVTLQVDNAAPDVGYEIAISDGEPPPGQPIEPAGRFCPEMVRSC